MTPNEMPVSALRARYILGGSKPCVCGGLPGCQVCRGTGQVSTPWSESYMCAVKKAMGVKGRKVFVSDIRKFIRDNPDFSSKRVLVTGDTYKGLLVEAVNVLKGRPPYSEFPPKVQADLVARIERKLAA